MNRAGAAAAILLLWCTGVLGAEQKEAAPPTDWPKTISQLQQEVYRRPGFAQPRQQLAIAHNNYGVGLGDQRQWADAIRELEEAIQLEPDNADFRGNLGRVYFNKAKQEYDGRQMEQALATLEQAIKLAPEFAPAYALKGEIEYGRQRLKEAKAAWQRSAALDPSQTYLAERLQQVTEELPVESGFERLSQAYFDLRYEEGVERQTGFDIQDALVEARRTVGADFADWPKYRLVVLIYSAESFRKLREETPEWVAGQFDGKIRVPLPSAQLDPLAVKRIIFHEYTHALVSELSDGRCPTWLNEGLAEYEGWRHGTQRFEALRKAYQDNQLVPWVQLSDLFSAHQPVDQVRLGYEESHSIAAYLIERYGFWRIRKILNALRQERPWEEMLAEEFHIKLPRLQTSWREWLSTYLAKPS